MLEFVVIVILVLGTWLGYHKGVIGIAASLLGFVLGLIGCWLFLPQMTFVAEKVLPAGIVESSYGTYAATILGAVVLWILVGVIVALIARGLNFAAHLLFLGPINRLGGAIAGLIVTTITLSLILNIWFLCSPPRPGQAARYQQGTFMPIVMGVAPYLIGVGELYATTEFENQMHHGATQDMPDQQDQ